MDEIRKLIDENHRQLSLEQELAASYGKDFDTLICSQLAMVYSISLEVVKSIGRPELLDDAFAIGLLRLVELVRIHDPSRARLSTLCRMGVEQRIRKQVSRLAEIGGVKQVTAKRGKIVPTGAVCSYEDLSAQIAPRVTGDDLPDLQGLIDKAHLSDDELLAINLRRRGVSIVDIADSFGYHRSKVRRIIASAVRLITETC